MYGREEGGAKNIYDSMIFRLIERFGSQIVTFAVSIILARKVAPEMYGVVSIANIFIALSNVFTISGVSNALIQKKDAEKKDFDTAIVLNLALTISMYVLIFLFAPNIANAYKQPLLKNVLRILMIVLPLSAVKAVFQAFIERKKKYSALILPTMVSCFFSGGLGIILAEGGWGVWALVAQSLSATLLNTILLIPATGQRFSFHYDKKRAKRLFSYGWKLLVADMLDTAYVQSKPLLIGLFYSASSVAFFNKGQSFPQLLVSNISSSINSVLFSYMSSDQGDINKIKTLVRTAVKTCTFVVSPLMLGMGLVGENFIKLLLTDKWLPAVPFLQVTCIYFALYPLAGAGMQGIKAIGRSDIILKTEIIKRVAGLFFLFIAVNQGVIHIAWAMVLTALFSLLVNMYPQKKYFNYSYREQFYDLIKNIWLLLPMGICVYLVRDLTASTILNMIIQIVVGMITYIATAWITKNREFIYLEKKLARLFKRR